MAGLIALGARLAFAAAMLVAVGSVPCRADQRVERWVLVMPFTTQSPDARVRWLGDGMSLVVADGLTALGVKVADHELRTRTFSSVGLPPAGVLSRATQIQVARLAGVSSIIDGQVGFSEGLLTVSARVIDPAGARAGPPISESGSLADLYDVGLAIAARLSAQLGAPAVPEALDLERPPVEAFQAYVQGLAAAGHDERVRLLKLAIERFHRFDRARLALADAHADVGDHERALAAARAVPASSPRAHAARFRVARALIELDRLDEAFEVLQALAEEQPAAAIFNNLGVVQLRRGATPESGKSTYYLTKAAEIAPDDPDILFNLGYAYWLDQNAEGAVYWLREAVRRGPTDGDTHAVLAAALWTLGATVEAGRERELAARLAARYEKADWAAGSEAGHLLGGLERVVESLDAVGALASNPAAGVEAADRQQLAAFHLDRARRAFDAEDDTLAIAEASRAVYLTPYDARAHLLLGRSYLRAGRARDAINAFRLSLWSEESADAHAYLGEALLAVRDVEGARLEVQRALALDGNHVDAKRVLERLGDSSPR